MSVTQTGLTRKSLTQLSKPELLILMDELKIENKGDETNPVLVAMIQESGKYVTTKERGAGKVSIDKDGNKIHPTLGKYIKVKVFATAMSNQKTSIFVSINLYTAEFQPSEIVELPIQVVKFLKHSGEVEHYFDPNTMSENGNMGAHLSRVVPSYIVELVNDELEETVI